MNRNLTLRVKIMLISTALFAQPLLLAGDSRGQEASGQQVYLVTIRPEAAVEGTGVIAGQLAAIYGGTVVKGGGGDDTFTIRVPQSRSRVLVADPRVKSVVPMGRVPAPETAVVETVAWSSGVSYSYDGAGNITQIGNDAFVYDGVSRLTHATVNSLARTYNYDAYGNRTGCTQLGPNDCQGFSINTAENKNRIAGAGYDASGNLTGLSGHVYSYDAVNMMTRDTFGQMAREFVYTADDERIATYNVGSSWNWTVREMDGKVLREFTSNDGPAGPGTTSWQWAKDFVWRGGLMLASRQPDGSGTTTYHYHLDHLGTPRRVTDQNDRIVGVHDYFAFGPELAGSTAEPSAAALKYTGHERDEWSSGSPDTLDYMHARYYSPWLGRFSSVDKAPAESDKPQTWNRYSYAINNPVLYTDPSGNIYDLYGFVNDNDEQKFFQALSAKTGLTVTNNNGHLDYARDQNGDAVVATDAKGHQLGSATARTDLMKGIDSTKHYVVQRTDNNPNVDMGIANGSLIRLDFADMRLINTGNNASGTFDAAMIFLHEGVAHALLGLHDPNKQTLLSSDPFLRKQKGGAVDWENKVRSELGLPLRSQYRTEDQNGKRYIPFANGPVWLP
jgi:RHS repeat-associated protein